MDAFAAKPNANTVSIVPLAKSGLKAWLAKQSGPTRAWLTSQGFKAGTGQSCVVPGRDGKPRMVVLGHGGDDDMWSFGALPAKLAAGRYAIDAELSSEAASRAAIAWALGRYEFTRYKKGRRDKVRLVMPEAADETLVNATAEAIYLGRDLVTTPAGDLGPGELAAAARELAGRHGATCKVLVGNALLKNGYPTIHAVGRASDKPPCLIDIRWGRAKAKKLTLVGKGVCFDSGGLDLKGASGMKMMKKDMGGAASVLALAHMIMATGIDVRLRVLIPAVENSVAGNAYHPMDVIKTRKGLTVEVGNTDAEGRLILCDALAEADTEKPDLLIDFATLTGAARVALGTELPALFCSDDVVAEAILSAGRAVSDPLWRMPLFAQYRRHLESDVADLNNISKVGPGGAITAALFLKEFVGSRTRWCHVDTMAWNNSTLPGRPRGGEVFGARAMHAMLSDRYG